MAAQDKRTQVVLTMLTQPQHANFAGNVHGGEIMKLMDSAAGAAAYKYARSSVVTARVDELQFHLPVHIGILVTCTATVVFVGSTSMEVIVTVDMQDLKSDKAPQRALSAYFTMVAIDEEGKPKKLAPLEVRTPEEKILFEEGKKRYQERKKSKDTFLAPGQ